MKQIFLILGICLLGATMMSAQSIKGKWWAQNTIDGRTDAIMEIKQYGNVFYCTSNRFSHIPITVYKDISFWGSFETQSYGTVHIYYGYIVVFDQRNKENKKKRIRCKITLFQQYGHTFLELINLSTNENEYWKLF